MAWLAPTRSPCMRQALPGAARCGQGRLWDCSRGHGAGWPLWGEGPSAGQDPAGASLQEPGGPRLGLLRGTKQPPGYPGTGPHPAPACSWLVSTFRISATQAALISGSGCLRPERPGVGACPHDAPHVSLCTVPGTRGDQVGSAALGCRKEPRRGHADRRARTLRLWL